MIILSAFIISMSMGILFIFYDFEKPLMDAQAQNGNNLSPSQMIQGVKDFADNAMKNTKAPPGVLPNASNLLP